DDYLVKPIDPDLLLATIAARLKRSRSTQALIEHDGLTGLLTHSAFLRRLQAAGAESHRSGEQFALVMLDIDHFKAVNDQQGHLVGDKVLASFGVFLRQQVRAGDAVARYGGEEFAILLRGADAAQSEAFTNRLLHELGRVVHLAQDGTPFHITFSAGVAMIGNGEVEDW